LKERVATPMAPRSRKRKSQYVKEHPNVTALFSQFLVFANLFSQNRQFRIGLNKDKPPSLPSRARPRPYARVYVRVTLYI